MIIDTIDHAEQYFKLGPGFKLAFEYLLSDRAKTDEVGTYELDSKRVSAGVGEYETTPFDPEGNWEAHRKYVDIQFMISGREKVGYAPLSTMTESQPYNEEHDYSIYRGQGTLLPFLPGTFGIYWPQDVHKPCIADGDPTNVRKIVMKVLVEE